MGIQDRIKALSELGKELEREVPDLTEVIARAHRKNKWFITDYVRNSIGAIRDHFLQANLLEKWLQPYQLDEVPESKKSIAIIMAGNLPLVGFHDFLCAYLFGFDLQIKLSSKDEVLLPYLVHRLSQYDPTVLDKTNFLERFQNFDAVIATGSNNSNRYFEYYFRGKPKILRKNRSSVAVLSGNESKEKLEALSDDIFSYFGLGCRNVSKIYLPKGYDVASLLVQFEKYKWVNDHGPYKNNYDYNRTLLLLNNTPHFASEFFMLVERDQLASPLASLHYQFYRDENDLKQKLEMHREDLQCVVGRDFDGLTTVPFGKAQHPELGQYADGVDVIEWMQGL